jgi:hypothetical protein
MHRDNPTQAKGRLEWATTGLLPEHPHTAESKNGPEKSGAV